MEGGELEDVFCLSKVLPTGFRPSAVRLGALVSMLLRGPVSGSVGVGGSDGNDGSPPLGLDFRMEVGVFWVGLVALGFDRSGGGGGAAGTTDLGGCMSRFTGWFKSKSPCNWLGIKCFISGTDMDLLCKGSFPFRSLKLFSL